MVVVMLLSMLTDHQGGRLRRKKHERESMVPVMLMVILYLKRSKR
jgi:hypothetical protein